MDSVFENVVNVLVLSVFLEAVIQGLKPLWNPTAKKLCVNQVVSMVLGMLLAIVGKFNLLDGMLSTENAALQYVLCAMTGISIGRGPSFIHDLWDRIHAEKTNFLADNGAGKAISENTQD